MIRTFKSAALKRYWNEGKPKGLPAQDLKRIEANPLVSGGGHRARRYGFAWIQVSRAQGEQERHLLGYRSGKLAHHLRVGEGCGRESGPRGLPWRLRTLLSCRRFKPAHPGEILREDVLPALGLPLSRVASHLGVSRQTLYDIINEKRGVTADIAARLGRAFGNNALFWLNLQSQYDAWFAERTRAVRSIRRLAAA